MPISHSDSTPGRALTPERWWSAPFQMFQTNLRETDAAFDVDAVLDVIEEQGADTWLVNAGGILSFYPTKLAFQTPNPHLAARRSGDLLGDALAAAHARGVRVMARMDFSKVTRRIAAEHPEWCYASASGGLQEYNGLISVCPSGDYYQERTFEILDEVIDQYPVDGFFFNWFGFNEVDYSRTYHGPCHCSACTRAFERHTGGMRLPTGPESTSYGPWRAFAADTIDSLTARIRDHIARRRPDAGLILGQSADIVFHEANNALGRELWPHATSEAVSAARSRRPDVPVLVNSVAFIDMPYRMAGEQAEHFGQYLAQAISRGANPSTYIMGVPGQIPYECLRVAGEVTRFHARHAEVYAAMSPAARTGLVRPDRLILADHRYDDATAEFRGLYSALQERHVPFDVVAQEHVEEMARTGGLGRYSLLILPDLGALTRELAAVLDEFTGNGGALLTTGSSAITDDSVQLASLPAVRRTAMRSGAELLYGTYVAAHPEPETPDVFPSPVLPIHGAYHYLQWDDDARRALTVLAQAPYGPPEKCHGHLPVDHPGYAVGSFGRGRVAIVPWTVGRTYRDLGLTAVRDLVVNVVRQLLDGRESTSADLPEQVEITVHRSGERQVVHLVNLSGLRRVNFGPPLPVRGGILRLRGADPKARVQALVSGRECPTRVVDGELVVDVPEFGLFEVIDVAPTSHDEGSEL
jgi:hypothetical protein